MPQRRHKLSTELYTKIVQELDYPSLRQCSKTSRVLWRLSRARLFSDVAFEYDFGSKTLAKSRQRTALLMKLCSSRQYGIFQLIQSLKLSFVFPEGQTPPQDALNAEPAIALAVLLAVLTRCERAKLQSIGIKSNVSIDWDKLPSNFKLAFKAFVIAPKVQEVSLQNFINLPADLFQLSHSNLRVLELQGCTVERSWKQKKAGNQGLRLTKLRVDAAFPFFDLYPRNTKAGVVHGQGLPYSELVSFASQTRTQKAFLENIKVLSLSNKSLRDIDLTFDNHFGKSKIPVVDLSQFPNLQIFKFSFSKTIEDVDTLPNLAVFAKAFLKPAAPPKVLKQIAIDLDLWDEEELIGTAKEVRESWAALDSALTHKHFARVKVCLNVAYNVEVMYRGAPPRSEIQAWADDQIGNLLPHLWSKDCVVVTVYRDGCDKDSEDEGDSDDDDEGFEDYY